MAQMGETHRHNNEYAVIEKAAISCCCCCCCCCCCLHCIVGCSVICSHLLDSRINPFDHLSFFLFHSKAKVTAAKSTKLMKYSINGTFSCIRIVTFLLLFHIIIIINSVCNDQDNISLCRIRKHIQRFSEVPDQLGMAVLSVTPGNLLLWTLLMQNFNSGISKISVTPENPLFPNPVLPKTSVSRPHMRNWHTYMHTYISHV